MIREFFASFLSVDSKFVHSIVPLLFSPGKLSLEYIRGRRATYIHPVILYVAVSIILFFMISMESSNKYESIGTTPSDSIFSNSDEAFDLELSNGDSSGWWYEKELIEEFYKRKKSESWEVLERETGVQNTLANRFFFSELRKAYEMDMQSFSEYTRRKMPIVLFLFIPILSIWL